MYLALEEVYLPLGAPVSKYTTLRKKTRYDPTLQTGLSPSLAGLSRPLLRQITLCQLTSDYNSPAAGWRLPFWAFPASVAPTDGILVSFFSSA